MLDLCFAFRGRLRLVRLLAGGLGLLDRDLLDQDSSSAGASTAGASAASASSSVGSRGLLHRRGSAAGASGSPRSCASIAASSSSLGSSPPSGTTCVFTVACTSWKSSIGTSKRPIRLIVSIPILRRSTRIFFVRHSSSAIFVGVTEPKSEPVGPAFTSKRRTVLLEDVRDLLRLVCVARLVPRALLVALAQLRDLRRRRGLGEAPRQQEVARVAARDVHDLAAQAERVDVVEEDDFHRAYPVT